MFTIKAICKHRQNNPGNLGARQLLRTCMYLDGRKVTCLIEVHGDKCLQLSDSIKEKVIKYNGDDDYNTENANIAQENKSYKLIII